MDLQPARWSVHLHLRILKASSFRRPLAGKAVSGGEEGEHLLEYSGNKTYQALHVDSCNLAPKQA